MLMKQHLDIYIYKVEHNNEDDDLQLWISPFITARKYPLGYLLMFQFRI